MKLFKLIMNCVMSVLLVLSVALNIFIFSVLGIHNSQSFKECLFAKEMLQSMNSITDNNAEDPQESTTTPAQSTTDLTNEDPIYEDEYVRITYMNKEAGLLGYNYKFLIENLSDQSITVSFDNVYIDGFKCDMSGLYCDELAPNTKAIDVFSAYAGDWEDFTKNPKKAEFTVQIIDPDTLITLKETTGRILFEL